jgi:uncharacterized membrane protein (DUF2068 family)
MYNEGLAIIKNKLWTNIYTLILELIYIPRDLYSSIINFKLIFTLGKC